MAAQPCHGGRVRQLAADPWRVTAGRERGDALPAHPLGQRLGQARLADAGLAGDQEQARAAGSLTPGPLKLRPFGIAAHQWNGGSGLRRHNRLGFRVHQLLVEMARRGAWLHIELTAQRRDAGVVSVQRRGAVVVQRVEAHQLGVGRFVERIVAQQRLRVADGLPVVSALLVQGSQLFKRSAVRLRQPILFGQQPIAVAAGQQLAAIGRHGLLQSRHLLACAHVRPGFLQASLERGDIRPAGLTAMPLHRQFVRAQEPIRVRHSPAQPMPEVAEVGAGLFFSRVRPEEEGKLLARHGAAAVQEEVRQQLLEASLVEALNRLVAVSQAERTKQVNFNEG